MPLSRLENFLKNAEGNILYVSPSDFDATDSFENQGNSLTRPFKTIQRALIEAARFSYQNGRNNDKIDRTTILVYPGTHYIDNRPGYSITSSGGSAVYKKRTGATTWTSTTIDEFNVNTNYDILDTNNDIYKFNSINGGVILPRGTSIIGYDLRKTKIRPLYVPNPEDTTVESSGIFNVTGTCYFSIFTFLDADTTKTVFRDYTDNRFVPNYSHHKLSSFTYADGVNKVVLGGTEQTDFTDLDMYYYKVARAYGDFSGRNIVDYPNNSDFETSVDEFRIVGALQANPFGISSIFGGDGISTPKNVITVTTKDFLTGDDKPHGLFVDSPVLVSGVTADGAAFNGSFTVKEVVGLTTFTYTSTAAPANANPVASDYESGIVTIESDTVSSASPYVFNCSIRSVYGLNGMWADGAKADGFKSMVVAQFTGVSLQKDDNAFLVYENGAYQSNATLDINSTQRPLHTNGNAIYKPDYENTHIRVSNNGFIQCVSIFAIGFAKHFLAESGGDMSITNSNSNFGAISLESTGFRDESFDRDDVGYVTHIIPPKEIKNTETEVTWLSLDVVKTVGVGSTSNLYLFNYKSPDVSPVHQVDGYRIGARADDNLNLTVTVGITQVTHTTPILMPVSSGTGVSAKKSYTVTRTGTQNDISNNTFTLGTNHQFFNGESVRVFSDTSQAPDGISVDTVYYAITTGLGANEIKLAYSLNDAIANQPISGINNNGGVLTIISSVSDKLPGDIGHPIQYDKSQGQWYITGAATTATNQIYNAIVGLGTTGLGNETTSTFVKRKIDTRSIEDRIYRVRYVIPKEFTNARPPQAGFVLQETKTVGVSTISFDNTYSLSDTTPPTYLRNEKIISNTTVGGVSNGTQTVTATTELPHGFIVGDKVKVQKVKSTNNPLGTGLTSTYNGSYQVLSVPNTKQFTYQISGVKINPGTYTNLINERDTRQERDQLPLVSREQYSGNYFIYRVNTIKNHVPGTQGQDGIYNLIVLASNVSPPTTIGYGISQKAFNQDVRNLYPQIDRDNFNSDPVEAVSFADLKTIGKVVTGDKKKSITKESINSFIRNTRIGFGITGVSLSGTGNTTITINTDIEHLLNSLKRVSISVAGSGYGNTTIYASSLTGGSGANGSVRANLAAGTVQSVSIVDPGCAYVVGNTLTVSAPNNVPSTLTVNEINNNVGDGIELSGFNQENLNGVFKILSVPSSKSFTIYAPSGVPSYTQNTSGRIPTAVLASKGVGITSFRFDTVSTGIVTVTTSTAHGLLSGNKFTIVGSGHTIYDKSFFVEENVGINTFTFYVGIVTQTKSSTTGTLLKSAISSNALNLTRGEENLGSRASYIYAGITTSLTTTLTTSNTTIGLSSAAGFNRGDYVIINAEILRLASVPSGNTFTVLRGQFSTYKTTAEVGTQVKKIRILPMEVRRPSFMRASSHTFEYLGYGPGNYSTGMPQKQSRTLTEDEVLTSQAREQSGGTVVYTGMNDLGEFYSGAKKLSSATGEEKVIDAPIITFTGDDAQGENQNKLSGIFDDVLVKESITIEGGDNGNRSSQFYGPVNFTRKVTNTSDEGINTKNLFIKGNLSQSKLITVGLGTPTSLTIPSVNGGDISLESTPTNYIGQVYDKTNGKWKKFGLISDSADILDIKVDRLGIGDPSVFSGVGGVGDTELYVAGDIKLQNVTITGTTAFSSNVVLNDVNFANINIQKTAFFSGIGGTSYAIYVDPPTVANSNTALNSRLYDLEVANNAYVSGNLGIGTTNPSEKLSVYGAVESLYDTIGEGGQFILRGKTGTPIRWNIDNHSVGVTTNLFRIFKEDNSTGANGRAYVGITTIGEFIIGDGAGALSPTGTANQQLQVQSGAYVSGNLGLGITNPTSKLLVNGTIGINASGDTTTAGRTQLSSSASGFVVNHTDNSPVIIQTQSVERLRVGAGGTITATANNTLTETRGSHLRLTNAGNGGDAVMSWDSTYDNANQRWYAGIDVSDSYAWKLANPIAANFNNEEFGRLASGGNPAETKLKIDTSGNATFLGNLTSTAGGLTLNTNKFTVAGATGNTVIAGSLNIGGAFDLSVSGSSKFSVDVSGNVTNSGTLNSTGKIKTFDDLEVVNAATVGTTLGVTGQVTASSFKIKDATNQSLLLRATGVAAALTKAEIDTALGITTRDPSTLTLNTAGTGLSGGSTTYNGSSATTFTVTSDATHLNTASTIVARDASGNFNASNVSLSGNLTVSSGNATGGGIILADDGDIVDLNDGYCAMRFSNGVRIHSGNRTGNAVITLGSNGTITVGSVSATSYAFNSPGDTDGGMYSDADGNIFFKTNNAERLRINSDGNVIVQKDITATTFNGSLNGNAATATNATTATTATTFTTNRSNYKGVTDGSVAGQMMWKQYGNGYTIFDASNSTSPQNDTVNNKDATVAWTATYPTLMGWNGVSTYGVRVDSARVADTVANATSANAGGTVVARDGNGDFSARIITATEFKGQLTGNVNGNATSATTATTATNANNINIFENTSSDTLTSVVLVNDQLTGNQRPFINSGLTYNASSNTLTATAFNGNATSATTATNADNINISVTTSSDTSTSVVLVANQSTGNQSPFIDSGLTYNASSNTLSAGNLSGTLNNALTLTTSGTGLSGSTTYNNSGATTFTVTSNATSSNEGGKIVARDANGDFNARSIVAQTLTGTLNNTLTLTTSGTGLSGSTTYNNSGARTFTVTSNATSSNEGGKIVARNADGDFSARYITATEGFLGNAASVTNGVYTTDFAKNTNSKGYQSFPGGFTIQWGNSSSLVGENASEYQTFAKPFTGAVFSVVATPSNDNPPPGDKKDHWSCLNVSLSGFTMRSYMEGRTQTYRWIAIGI
jgi:hypothetical protein